MGAAASPGPWHPTPAALNDWGKGWDVLSLFSPNHGASTAMFLPLQISPGVIQLTEGKPPCLLSFALSWGLFSACSWPSWLGKLSRHSAEVGPVQVILEEMPPDRAGSDGECHQGAWVKFGDGSVRCFLSHTTPLTAWTLGPKQARGGENPEAVGVNAGAREEITKQHW